MACLIARNPRIALLDEPAAGLASAEVEELGRLIRRLHARTGMTLLIIEHDVPLLASLADRMVAMDRGRVIAVGAPDEVRSDPAGD